MRPQDIVILLKIVSFKNGGWQYRDLASQLFMPVSEISVSLQRSNIAGLISTDTRKVHRQSLMEFLQYGLRYVFPISPEAMVTGMPAAHSHPFYKQFFGAEINYAWPYDEGNIRGLKIEPLHTNVPKAATQDELLYRLLASVDILRVGKIREVNKALEELKKVIL
jgi:hypothetical protein